MPIPITVRYWIDRDSNFHDIDKMEESYIENIIRYFACIDTEGYSIERKRNIVNEISKTKGEYNETNS